MATESVFVIRFTEPSKAYQALSSFKGGSSFYTWVYRIAVNKTINFLKQRKNRTHMSLNDLDFNAEHDPDMLALVSDKTPRREAGSAPSLAPRTPPCGPSRRSIR